MYCRKCGKWMDYEAEVCEDCKRQEQAQSYQQPATYEAPQPTQPANSFYGVEVSVPKYRGSRMKKFGLALAAVIVAQFALGFFMGIIMGIEEALDGYDSSSMYLVIGSSMYALYVIGFALAIFSLIGGIVSVVSGFGAKKRGEVTPIPAIILGFIAMVETLFTLIVAYGAVTMLLEIL